jgi:GMP synthase (glutamine-hydrolysing)
LPDHDKLQAALDTYVASVDSEFKAHLLPVRTVGVQGDGRSYKYLAGIEGPADWPRLFKLAAAIPNNNHAVNRVCYLGPKPVERATLDVTPTHLTHNAVEQARQADAIVTKVLRAYNLMGIISQMPVVSFPVNFGVAGARAIALRPFKTPDFMTGIAARPVVDIPEAALKEMVATIIKEVPGISRVVYDLSSKPPGTTEWE